MLLTLSVNVGAAENDERAHVSDLLAATLAKVLRHGHTATLSTNTYDEDDDDPTEFITSPEDDAYRRGYQVGFGDGMNLHRLGEPADNPTNGSPTPSHTFATRETRAGVLVVPGAMAGAVRYDGPSGYVDVPGVGRLRIPAGVTVEFIPNDHTVPVPEGADNPAVHLTDSAGEVPPSGDRPGWTTADIMAMRADVFPPTMAAPTDTAPPPWLYTQVAAALRTEPGRPSPETLQAIHEAARDHLAEQGSERTTVLPVAAQRPDGERPAAGPGAPLSAYDTLSLSIGWDYEFPRHPEDGDDHTDTEGAEWQYDESRRYWSRMSYPAEWAPASPVNFTPVYLNDSTI